MGLGAALVYWFIHKMGPVERQQTIDTFKRANYGWVLMAPVIGFISNFSRAQRWRLLLEPLGHKPGFWNTFFSVMMMYFVNLIFPRGGEVSRCAVLARYENVPLDKSIGTMVVERLVDLISILIILAILFISQFDLIYNSIGHFRQIVNQNSAKGPNYAAWAVIAGIAIALVAVTIYILRKYGMERLKQTARERLLGFIEGLKSIKDLRSPWQFLFHSVLIWFCYFMMGFVSFHALPETAHLGVFAAMAVLVAGGFAIVATPGGIGVYPIAIAYVLSIYGIKDGVIGGAYGYLAWAAQTGSVLFGGAISLILLAIINREPSLEKVTLKT